MALGVPCHTYHYATWRGSAHGWERVGRDLAFSLRPVCLGVVSGYTRWPQEPLHKLLNSTESFSRAPSCRQGCPHALLLILFFGPWTVLVARQNVGHNPHFTGEKIGSERLCGGQDSLGRWQNKIPTWAFYLLSSCPPCCSVTLYSSDCLLWVELGPPQI